METVEISAAKKTLRSAARAARAGAFARHGADAALALAMHGLGFASRSPSFGVVSGYSAIGDELDAKPLLFRAYREGMRIALPAIQGKGLPLVFRSLVPHGATAPGVWGIEEPLPEAETVSPDIVLVPLLAFDAQGYRLGYGGGFYDRTLAGLRAIKPVSAIGLAFDEQEIDAVPHLDYDEPLDWVLTPAGPRRCHGT